MKLKFIYILLVFLTVGVQAQSPVDSVSYAAPKEYTIGGIEVTGAEFTDKNVIKLLSTLTVGDKIVLPGDKSSDAIKSLWKQGLFEDIKLFKEKIIGDAIFLRIDVTERPRLSKFSFKGNVKKNEADEMRNKIRMVRERVVTDYTSGFIKNTVRDYYVNKGFYNAQISITSEKDRLAKTPHVILYINIDKGSKVRIKKLTFHGNSVVGTWKLHRKMSDTKVWHLYNPFNSGKYLEENLKKDLPTIIEIYNSKGYRDARVLKDTAYFVNKKRVAIDVYLDEGHKFYFGDFKWFGNTKYRSGQLDTILSIKKGDVFDQTHLDQKLFMNPNGFDISSLYMDDGYLFFQVNPSESNVHNDTIDFDIHMYEGKQAIINKVTVSGNDKTNDHVIYREIRTRPGQLFRRSDIIRTVRELSQLGYFNAEKIVPTPLPNPADGTVDIDYKVEEKPSDQITLSGGYGGNRLIGTLGITFNNFSMRNLFHKSAWRPLPTGDGQRLSVQVNTNGLLYQNYNISFSEPWLGGRKPNMLSGMVGYSSFSNGIEHQATINGILSNNPKSYFMNIISGTLTFGKRLKWPDDFFQMYTSVGYNNYELWQYPAFVFNTGYSNDINLNLTIARNSVDAPIFPKNGSNIALTCKWTPPYSVFDGRNYNDLIPSERYRFTEYQKYKFTAEWFTQLTNKRAAEGKEARNLVLRTKVGFGFLSYYNPAVGFSPFERFYLGGSGLSGYQNFVAREIIALRGYPDNSLSGSKGDPLVARYIMELRFPITLNPQATIFILGFAEAGNTWPSFKTYNPFEVKRSAGFGLRVFLPMFGLLGVDYGWGFDPVPGNPGAGNGVGQFHFTIGGTLGEL